MTATMEQLHKNTVPKTQVIDSSLPSERILSEIRSGNGQKSQQNQRGVLLSYREGRHGDRYLTPLNRTQAIDNTENILNIAQEINSDRSPDPSPFIPRPGSLLEAFDAVVAFDEEWQQCDAQGHPDAGGAYNKILSYQWSAIAQVNGAWVYGEGIHYTEAGRRITSARLLGLALASAGIGYKNAEGLRVIMVGHYAIADVFGFADRVKFLRHICKDIRRTVVTLGSDRAWRADFGERHVAKIKVRLADTYLLAPQGQQKLADISKTLAHEKVTIDEAWLRQMGELLNKDGVLFAEYAQEDTRATLEYYVKTIDTLQTKVGVKRVPLTLGGAAVDAYIQGVGGETALEFLRSVGKQQTTVILKGGRRTKRLEMNEARRATETFAADCYHGGLNTVYNIGRQECGPDEVILDIDFAGAYSAALGAIPAIDWTRSGRFISKADKLRAYFAGDELVHEASMPNILGLVEFAFPASEMYPCLPIRAEGGLVYPLRGTTYCTGVEIDLALRLGATVKLREVRWFPPYHGADGKPVRPFADFIGRLNQERRGYAKGTLENILYKEVANSLYGKLAQGIRLQSSRELFADDTGEFQRTYLKPSKITTAHYAAACTGVVRAALSALVYGLSRCPGFTVLSATTDGCMLVAPRRFDLGTLPATNGKLDCSKLDLLALYPEIKALERYPAIRGLIMGRQNMDLEGPWIEAKHAGDAAVNMKTRVYTMAYRGVVQHEAKTGIHLQDGQTLEGLHAMADIPIEVQGSLPSARDLIEGTVPDFVPVDKRKRINTDYDYKRVPLDDGSGSTRPLTDKDEFHRKRQTVANIRKERKSHGEVTPGNRATVDRVTAVSAGMRMKSDETIESVYRRYVNWAVARGEGGWHTGYQKHKVVAEKLGIDYQTVFKNYRRKQFEPQKFAWSERFEVVMRDVAKRLGMFLTPSMIDLLCTKGAVAADA
jgi:hypothetical protein